MNPMPVLLDTCAVSEYSQKAPNSRAIAYLESLDPADTFVSAVTIAELRKGIELLPVSKRRERVEDWYQQQFLPRYGSHVIPFDREIADRWGRLVARLIRVGFSIGYADSLIAATVLAYGWRLVTRNEGDFVHCGITIVNPWK
jgi:toxin FitB